MRKTQLCQWNQLPEQMRTPIVKKYYDSLEKKKTQLKWKRYIDICLAWFLLVILTPIMVLTALLIYCDSPGKILFCQKRVTQYGRVFQIYKFRTMAADADKLGAAVTTTQDVRITRIGRFLRKYRLDELPQLFNIIAGDMTFVGTRPEVMHYVKQYTPKMWATLLLPAGVTSLASIKFKDEGQLLEQEDTAKIDKAYLEKILPQKMNYNLLYLKDYSFWKDWRIMAYTLLAVLRKP